MAQRQMSVLGSLLWEFTKKVQILMLIAQIPIDKETGNIRKAINLKIIKIISKKTFLKTWCSCSSTMSYFP